MVLVPNGHIDRLKAGLVTKGYTQIYGLDYGDTFSLVAKIASVCLSLTATQTAKQHWPLYKLDFKILFFMVISQKSFIWSNRLVGVQVTSRFIRLDTISSSMV